VRQNSAVQRGCVKTLMKIFGQKINRLERPTSDDRNLGNGFGTPNFSASLPDFEFSHSLSPLESPDHQCPGYD
jgi:hypothetical protein